MKKIRLIPALITLLAGAITIVSLYLLGYDYITSLLILLAVIVIFYVIGVIIMRIFRNIYQVNKEKEDAIKLEQMMNKKRKKVVTEDKSSEEELAEETIQSESAEEKQPENS